MTIGAWVVYLVGELGQLPVPDLQSAPQPVEQHDFLQQQLAHVHVPDLQQSPLEQHFLSEDMREGGQCQGSAPHGPQPAHEARESR